MKRYDEEQRKINAEVRAKKAEIQAIEGAENRAAYDAVVAARDANMERLKAERLARENAARAAGPQPQGKP